MSIVPPTDFVVSPHFNPKKKSMFASNDPTSPEVKNEQSEKEEKSEKAASRGADREKNDGKKSANPSDRDKKAEEEQPKSAPDVSTWDEELAIHAEHPDMHWTDVVYRSKRVRVVDLTEQIRGKLVRIQAECA